MQVIGDVISAHTLPDNTVVICAREGALMAGPNAQEHEQLCTVYLSIRARDMAARAFFSRCCCCCFCERREKEKSNRKEKKEKTKDKKTSFVSFPATATLRAVP